MALHLPQLADSRSQANEKPLAIQRQSAPTSPAVFRCKEHGELRCARSPRYRLLEGSVVALEQRVFQFSRATCGRRKRAHRKEFRAFLIKTRPAIQLPGLGRRHSAPSK